MFARLGPTAPLVVTALVFGLVGCTAGPDAESVTTSAPESVAEQSPAESVDSGSANQKFPDVIEVKASCEDRVCDFEVTMTSPYDTPERYADGWRLVSPDGTELGAHTLGHDHTAEQPFTRTQTGVRIPEGIDSVTVEGRDQVNGYGGKTVTVDIG